LIENSQLGENVTVLYSVVINSIVQAGTQIGPYAHLRAQVEVGSGCRVEFCGIENTTLGSKRMSPICLIWETPRSVIALISVPVRLPPTTTVLNIPTQIGDRTKTGSNSVLVAPKLGADVNVAAGSVVTEDVPDDCLVIARARQMVKPGWL